MNYNTITMAFSSKLSPRLSHLGPHYHTRKSFVNRMTKTSILSHRCLNTSSSYSFSSPTSSSFQRISPSCFQKTRFQTRLNMNSSTTKGMTTMAYTEQEMKVVQDMLYRVRECNNVPPEVKQNLLHFTINGERVGKVTKKVAELLCKAHPTDKEQIFQIINNGDNDNNGEMILTLTKEAGNTLEEKSDAVMSVMKNLREKGVIKGWRDELYPLSKGFYDEPVLLVERAAAPFLGMQQYGVHINGIVKSESGEEKMWMARRSKTKSKYPNMLDHIVAGGQPAGLSLMENVLKECAEEAGIPEDITLAGIQPVGAVSYEEFEPSKNDNAEYSYDGVVSRSLLFNYDLILPNDFIPKVVDGEVEEFFVWSIDEILVSMDKDYEDPIKPNCYLVIIDFLLRKGYLSPDVPGYLDVFRELRGGYCG